MLLLSTKYVDSMTRPGMAWGRFGRSSDFSGSVGSELYWIGSPFQYLIPLELRSVWEAQTRNPYCGTAVIFYPLFLAGGLPLTQRGNITSMRSTRDYTVLFYVE